MACGSDLDDKKREQSRTRVRTALDAIYTSWLAIRSPPSMNAVVEDLSESLRRAGKHTCHAFYCPEMRRDNQRQ